MTDFSQVDEIIYAHDQPITCIKWLGPNSGFFASAGNDRVIKIWDTRTFKLLRILDGHASDVTTLDVLSNGRLASGSADMTVKVWNLNTAQVVASYKPAFNASITSIRQLNDGNLVVAGASSDLVFLNLNASQSMLTLSDNSGQKPNELLGTALGGVNDKLIATTWKVTGSAWISIISAVSYQKIYEILVPPTTLVEFFPYGNKKITCQFKLYKTLIWLIS